MAIENEDWLYVGGAAVGGLLLGSLGRAIFASEVKAEPVFTGLTRRYKPESGPNVLVEIWALSDSQYVPEFLRMKDPAREPAFPDLERRTFPSPSSAALFADDLMWQLDHEPLGAWGPMVNEASEARRRERKPARSGA